MAITRQTKYGKVAITYEAVSSLAGGIAMECYGVVKMASQQLFKDSLSDILLKKKNFSKGIIVTKEDEGLVIDMYIIVSFGTKISQVVNEVQKKVTYVMEKTLECNIKAVNVHVQDVKEMK